MMPISCYSSSFFCTICYANLGGYLNLTESELRMQHYGSDLFNTKPMTYRIYFHRKFYLHVCCPFAYWYVWKPNLNWKQSHTLDNLHLLDSGCFSLKFIYMPRTQLDVGWSAQAHRFLVSPLLICEVCSSLFISVPCTFHYI
jgi:hypothetical protein